MSKPTGTLEQHRGKERPARNGVGSDALAAQARVFVDRWPEEAFQIFAGKARFGLRDERVGRVTVWQPGARLAFTWRELPWPEGVSTDVDVLFESLFGGTLLTVEHSGFERLGPEACATAREYQQAWAHAVGGVEGRLRPPRYRQEPTADR